MRHALVALALTIAVLPSAAAYHLSVGSQDAVGVSPDETPSNPDVGDDLYQRGVETECPSDLDPDASSPGDLGDGFCGRLVYHAGTDLEQVSPTDQDLHSPIGTFDVVLTQYVGTYGLDTCYPWCAPAGTTVYGLASQTLTETFPELFPAGAGDEDDEGHQSYAVDLRTPHPTLTAPTGAQGSGWMLPTTDPTFVGFLQDGNGDPIDDQALGDIVTASKGSDGGLPQGALPTVCGFSPEFGSPGPTREAPLTATPTSVCDVGFTWRSEGTDTDFGPSGNDRCASATYVCGANQPAWYGQLTCKGWTGCQAPHEAGDPWHSTGDYDVWHFVAAPVPSLCGT